MSERNVWYLNYRAKIDNVMGNVFYSPVYGPVVVVDQTYDKRTGTRLELVKAPANYLEATRG